MTMEDNMRDRIGKVNGIYYHDLDIVFDFIRYDIIEAGFNKGLDISTYVDENLTADQMKEIYMGLLDGVDVRKYNNWKYDSAKMNIMRLFLKRGFDVSCYMDHSADQLKEIYDGLMRGIDVTKYDSIKFNHHQMRIIRVGLERNIDMDQLIDPSIDPFKMVVLRQVLEKGMDISSYIELNISCSSFIDLVNRDMIKAGKGQVRVGRYSY